MEARSQSLARLLWIAAGLTVLIGLVWALRSVLTPLFFAFLIAYVLDPVVDRLEAWRIPRALAIVILLLVVLSVIGLFLGLALPGIVRDIVVFVGELPRWLARTLGSYEPFLHAHGIAVPHSVDEALTQLEQQAHGLAPRAVAPVGTVLTTILGGTASVLGTLATALVVPVFAFYLLYDFDRIKERARDLVPHRWRAFIVDVASEVDTVLGQFIRGQLTVMAVLGTLYAVGFALCGVRLAVPIGIVAGLLSFIPYVGGATALVAALAMSLVDWTGWTKVVFVVGVYGAIQALDGLIITPRIVGSKVGLGPLWVLIALMVGSALFGFLGVLLAVPSAAVIKIFVVRFVSWYRETHFYREGAPPPREETGPVTGTLEAEGLPDSPETKAAKELALAGEASTKETEP